MKRATVRLVRARAGERCEYCRICESALSFLPFHIEHIRPRQHGGTDAPDNLALACHHCNLHKGPNLTAVDPRTGRVVRLFNPRTQPWPRHFRMRGAWVIGLTPAGRATVQLLRMNADARVELRSELAREADRS